MSPQKPCKCLPQTRWSDGQYSISSIQRAHIESIRNWRNAQMDVLRQKKAISANDQISYFDSHIWPSFDEAQPQQILMVLFHDEKLIGYGGLVHIDWEFKRAEISFLLNPERTLNPELYRQDFLAFLRLVKELTFDGLGFHRIFVETYSTRTHHISVLEEFGFSQEGLMRDHVLIHGNFVNSLIHGYINK